MPMLAEAATGASDALVAVVDTVAMCFVMYLIFRP